MHEHVTRHGGVLRVACHASVTRSMNAGSQEQAPAYGLNGRRKRMTACSILVVRNRRRGGSVLIDEGDKQVDRRETEQLLEAIHQARAADTPAAMATIVRVKGSAYRREGTRM